MCTAVVPEDVVTVRRYGDTGHNAASPSAQFQESLTTRPEAAVLPSKD
jgi:hypothetical protein